MPGGGGGATAVLVIVLIAACGGAGYALWRRREQLKSLLLRKAAARRAVRERDVELLSTTQGPLVLSPLSNTGNFTRMADSPGSATPAWMVTPGDSESMPDKGGYVAPMAPVTPSAELGATPLRAPAISRTQGADEGVRLPGQLSSDAQDMEI